MNWFYNMENKKRLLLAAVSWVPFFICICAAPEVFLVVPTLILAGVFTMLTAIAHDKEKKQAEAEKKAARTCRFDETQKHQVTPRSLDEIREENRVLSAQLDAIEAKINDAEQCGGESLSPQEMQALSDDLKYIQMRIAELKREATKADPN